MNKLGTHYLWLMSVAVPAAGFAAIGCSSDPAAPSSAGGSSNVGTGGSVLSSGGFGNTFGGVSSFGGATGGSSPSTTGGTTLTTGGTGVAGGNVSTTGGNVSTTGGSISPAGGGGAVGATGGVPSTAGGTGGVSAGGAGGAGPKAKLCASKAPAAPVFVDFETYDGVAAAPTWAFSPVASSYAGFWAGGTPTPTLSVLGGHAGNYGFNVSVVSGTGSWAGIGTWMSPVTCLDASAFTGITLWVRGTTPTGLFSVHLNLEETTLPDATDMAGGGTCTGDAATCTAPTALNIPVTADWTQVILPWAMFTGGLNGTTAVVPTGDRITGLAISFGFAYELNPAYVATDPASQQYIPMPGNIDFTFDDVAFSM